MKPRTVDYDRLASSAPLNADAARAYAMTGESEPDAKISEHVAHYEAPPKTSPPVNDPSLPDLTGRKVGHFTVVGFLRRPGRKGRWLVKCLCGRYEERSTKGVTHPSPTADGRPQQCQRCNHLHHLQRQSYFDARGRWPEAKQARTGD